MTRKPKPTQAELDAAIAEEQAATKKAVEKAFRTFLANGVRVEYDPAASGGGRLTFTGYRGMPTITITAVGDDATYLDITGAEFDEPKPQDPK